MSWTAPVFNGGSALLDYRVWSDQGLGGAFTVLQESVTTTDYIAVGLTQGLTYKFKVQANNAYGHGDYSNTVSVLAAQTPQ